MRSLRSAACTTLALGSVLSAALAGAAVVPDAESPSLIVGQNGLGMFAYRDRTTGDLMVGRCIDASCSEVTTSVVDGAADVGLVSMAAGPLGPVIAYEDRSGGGARLKLALCADPACAAAATPTVDPDIHESGNGLSVAVGMDGRPIIAYASIPSTSFTAPIRVAHCDDAACTAVTVTTYGQHSRAKRNDIAIGPDGLAVIAWAAPDALFTQLDAIHCSNVACTAATKPAFGRAAGAALGINSGDGFPSLAFGANGLPVLASTYTIGMAPQDHAVVSRCLDASCDARSQQSIAGRNGPLGLAVGGDDRPRLVVGQTGPVGSPLPGLDFVTCLDAACTQEQRTCLAPSGSDPSLVLDAVGPLVAYGTANQIVVTRPGISCGPGLAIGDASGPEPTGVPTPLSFAVTLAAASTTAVTVDYATVGGTAQPGIDYVAASGTVTFPPQQTSATVEVTLLPDGVPEGDETFQVVLSNASGAVMFDGVGVGTIVDDDPPRIVAGDCTTVEEDAGTHGCVFAVDLVPVGSAQPVTVDFATAPGTATPGVDYLPASGTLTFAPGTTSLTLSVSVVGDTQVELDETFFLELSNATNATIFDPTGLGTVRDDDAVSLSALELTHGSSLRADAAAQPGPTADVDHYRVAQAPWGSYEVLVDEVSGDAAPGLEVQRLAEDNLTVRQTGVAEGTGTALALRWARPQDTDETRETIRVRGASCTTACGADDGYRLRLYETTAAIPRFNNSGTQVTVLVLQNPTDREVNTWAQFWDVSGVAILPAPYEAEVPAHGVLVLATSALPEIAGRSGSITIAHDGPYGALAGKAVALEPATGFSFDSPLGYKPR